MKKHLSLYFLYLILCVNFCYGQYSIDSLPVGTIFNNIPYTLDINTHKDHYLRSDSGWMNKDSTYYVFRYNNEQENWFFDSEGNSRTMDSIILFDNDILYEVPSSHIDINNHDSLNSFFQIVDSERVIFEFDEESGMLYIVDSLKAIKWLLENEIDYMKKVRDLQTLNDCYNKSYSMKPKQLKLK